MPGLTSPTTTTGSYSNVSDTSATTTGTYDAGNATSVVGIEWGTETGVYTHTVIATGNAGAFTVVLTGLPPGAGVFYRSYITTLEGTAYGEEATFTTLVYQYLTLKPSFTLALGTNFISPAGIKLLKLKSATLTFTQSYGDLTADLSIPTVGTFSLSGKMGNAETKTGSYFYLTGYDAGTGITVNVIGLIHTKKSKGVTTVTSLAGHISAVGEGAVPGWFVSAFTGK